MKRLLIITFFYLVTFISFLFSENLNYLLDIKYKDFPDKNFTRIVFYFELPPPLFDIKQLDNRTTLKFTFYNTDIKKFYGSLKVNSEFLDLIKTFQNKDNLEISLKFKRQIKSFSKLKANKPPLIYLKVIFTEIPLPPPPPKELEKKKEKKTKLDNLTKKLAEIKKRELEKSKIKKPIIKQKPEKPKIPEKILKVKIKKLRKLYEEGLGLIAEKKYNEAIPIFKTIINQSNKNNPYNIKAKFRLIDCYYFMSDKKNPHEIMNILKMYQQILAEYPNTDESPWAVFQMANCNKILGFYEEAGAYYRYIIKQYPKSIYTPKALLEAGNIAYKMKKYNTALKYFREILKKYPNRIVAIDANFKVANCLYTFKKFKQALNVYLEAMKKWPDYINKDPETLYCIGNTYFNLRKYKIAREYFLKVRNLFPKSEFFDIALLKIGETYVKEKKYKDALYVFKRVVQVTKVPENQIIARLEMAQIGLIKKFKQREILREYGEFLQPDKAFKYIIKHYPKYKLTHIAYSRLIDYYLNRKNYIDTVFYIEEFLSKYPGSPIRFKIAQRLYPGLRGFINTHFLNGNYLIICSYYEKYKETYLKDFKPLKTFKQIYYSYKNLGLFKFSRKFITQLHKKYPRDDEVFIEKIYLLINNGEYKLALKKINSFFRLFPNTRFKHKAIFYKGLCFEKLNNFELARKNYFLILKDKNFNTTDVNYRIAKTYYKQGDFKNAYKYFKLITNTPSESIEQYKLKNSYFYKAYCNYLLKNYISAAIEFQDYAKLFSDDKKTSEVYYMTLLSYYREGAFKQAKEYFEKIKNNFKDEVFFKLSKNLVEEIKWLESLEI